MKAIYEFYWDCGRVGEVVGIFVAEQSEVESAIGKNIYFGEVLGKHSDIYGILKEKDLTIKSTDQTFINKFESIMGFGTISGHNPLEYIEGE